jgi:uncharacterized cupredoxin-like copper-binding protein
VPDDVPELEPAPEPAPRDLATLPLIFGTIAVLALAVVLSVAALVAGDDDGSDTGASTSAHVSLTEFAITPDAVTVAAGGTVHITNDGSAVHNLAVTDTDLKTPDIAAGETGELDVSSLDPGSYELLCLIPGHADSGMTASLTITEGGEAAAASDTTDSSDSGTHDEMDYAQMTEDMLATFSAYPAETEGIGNQLLEPTEVTADGTKVFDLTMEAAPWERAPGDVVEAMTFNGMVPGPLMDLEIGDKVQVRVQNDLEIATDVHFHGLNVENGFDGVSPLTQDLIEPGASFTYEFTTDEPAVAMYHPHAHGHMLLPDGMFGGVLVGDLPLPTGQTVGYEQLPADVEISQRIPMVLNDSGVIGLTLNGKSFPATQPYTAEVGDWVLIDYWNEGNLIHPMHLHQFDQVVVGKDGFPVPQPYAVDTLNVAPGERYSVLVHINKPGAWVWHCHILPHVESEAGMFGMVTAFIVE